MMDLLNNEQESSLKLRLRNRFITFSYKLLCDQQFFGMLATCLSIWHSNPFLILMVAIFQQLTEVVAMTEEKNKSVTQDNDDNVNPD